MDNNSFHHYDDCNGSTINGTNNFEKDCFLGLGYLDYYGLDDIDTPIMTMRNRTIYED